MKKYAGTVVAVLTYLDVKGSYLSDCRKMKAFWKGNKAKTEQRGKNLHQFDRKTHFGVLSSTE